MSRQSKLAVLSSTTSSCCLETQTKPSQEEYVAEGLTRTESSGIVLRAGSCTQWQSRTRCSQLALCKGCKEGTRRILFWSLGEWKTGILLLLHWRENKPLCFFIIYLFISEKKARNLILSTRKTRHLFCSYCTYVGREEHDSLVDLSQKRVVWLGFLEQVGWIWGFLPSLRTKQAWSWDRKVLMSNCICFFFLACQDFLMWALRPTLALNQQIINWSLLINSHLPVCYIILYVISPHLCILYSQIYLHR